MRIRGTGRHRPTGPETRGFRVVAGTRKAAQSSPTARRRPNPALSSVRSGGGNVNKWAARAGVKTSQEQQETQFFCLWDILALSCSKLLESTGHSRQIGLRLCRFRDTTGAWLRHSETFRDIFAMFERGQRDIPFVERSGLVCSEQGRPAKFKTQPQQGGDGIACSNNVSVVAAGLSTANCQETTVEGRAGHRRGERRY